MNFTLLSYNLYSLVSASPFYTVNHLKEKVSMKFYYSKFSHFFSNIIFMSTNYHNSILINNIFGTSLKSALVFINQEATIPNSTKVNNKKFISTTQYNNSNLYGNIEIMSCIFQDCQSEIGGAILIEQECSVLILDSIFNRCLANDGGSCYICQKRKPREIKGQINDDKLDQINIQSCCFQNCEVRSSIHNGFGSSLVLAGKKVTLLYDSTFNVPSEKVKSKGALFDVQNNEVSSQHVNSTGGNSKFCGAFDIRRTEKQATINFQSIMLIESMYVTSFTKFEREISIDISHCNFIKNVLCNNNEQSELLALIHVANANAVISRCLFVGNNFGDKGKIASKSGTKNSIEFIECKSDTFPEGNDFNGISKAEVTLNIIDHLSSEKCHQKNFDNYESTAYLDSRSYLYSRSKAQQLEKTYMLIDTYTIVPSYIAQKSVTLAVSFDVTNRLTQCESDASSMCETDFLIETYSQSISHYYTLTYVPSVSYIELVRDLDDFRNEKTVGFVCILVEIFFIIVSLIVFIVKKKCTKDDIEINDLSINEDDELEQTRETIQQTKDFQIDMIKPDENPKDDSWL